MLVDLVKRKLGMRSENPFLEDGQTFRQWGEKSSFTVCKWEW